MVLVIVVEKKTGECIAIVPVVSGMIDVAVTEEDFIKEAWKCVIEDKSVTEDSFDDYTFQIKAKK